jgi:hypothetical protein
MNKITFTFILLIIIFSKDFFHFWDAQTKEKRKFDWPIITENISDRITSVFGESRWDHFHNGLDIASYYESARAIGEGKLLYSRYASDDPFREEWGSGDTVWVDHGKGTYSAYYHLNPGRKNLTQTITKGQELGITGNTGHSSGGHLHFVLTMDYGKKIVNPLLFLPKTTDEMPPLIGGLSVHVGDRYSNINTGDTINLSDSFPFSVYIQDSGVRKSQRWGVQAVQFSLNGKVVKESRFDSIRFIDGSWLNDDGVSFPELFFKDRYLVGNLSLPSGEHTIEVIATDFHGNTAIKSFTFYVSRI